jgi:iduronate 2-sulfatase
MTQYYYHNKHYRPSTSSTCCNVLILILLLLFITNQLSITTNIIIPLSLPTTYAKSISPPLTINNGQNPNILFIIVDDLDREVPGVLHPSHPLSWLNNTFAPNFRQLVKESLFFDRAYVQVASCNPSRASFLTSRRPTDLQLWTKDRVTGLNDVKRGRVPLLTQDFKKNGYWVYGTGKVFHKEAPWTFDEWINQGTTDNTKCGNNIWCTLPPGQLVDIHTAQSSISMIQSHLNGKHASEPFLLLTGFCRPHFRYSGSPDAFQVTNQISSTSYTSVMNNTPDFFTRPIPPWSGTHTNKQTIMSADKAALQRQGIAGSIQWMDYCLGKLLQGLRDLGVYDNMVIFLISDNGQMLGEHSLFGKSVLYEPAIRIPFLIRHPKYPSSWGKRSGARVELLDIMPTIQEISGVDLPTKPEPMRGISLVPLLKLGGILPTEAKSLVKYRASLKEAAITMEFRCTDITGILNQGSPGDQFFGDFFACSMDEVNVPRNRAEMIGISIRVERWTYIEWRSMTKKSVALTSINWEQSALWGRELYDENLDDGLLRIDGIHFQRQNLAPCPNCYPRYCCIISKRSIPTAPTTLPLDNPKYDYSIPNPDSLPSSEIQQVVSSLSVMLRSALRDDVKLCSGRGMVVMSNDGETITGCNCNIGWKGNNCQDAVVGVFG